MNASHKVLILGGGISGLSAAWRFLEAGIPVTLLESAVSPGGLAGTVAAGPYRLDFGPHSFFSEDEEIRKIVLGLFEGGLPEIQRSVKLHYRGKFLDYPFTPIGLLLKMGFLESLRTLWSYLLSRFKSPSAASEDEDSVEGWAVKNFGRRLYESFFKPYTEQFWKVPCSQLSARTIPSHTRTSFTEALKILFKKNAGGKNLLQREKLPTYYPQFGYGEIAEKISEKIKLLGGQILCPVRITRVSRMGDEWHVFYLSGAEEKELRAGRVISTLPLPQFISMMEPDAPAEIRASAQFLEFRPILVLGIVTSKQNILDCAYQYTLDRPYNRLSEMNRFSPKTSPEDENILALEIPCVKTDPVWQMSREELFEICLPALEKDGVLSRADAKGLLLVKAPAAYPIYKKGYETHLDALMRHLQSFSGLHTLGRSGEFMYMDADRCMRRAFDLADELAGEPMMRVYAGA